LFDEIFRVLRPGGDFLIADVKRTRDHDRLTAWRFDWLAKWGGEPYWRATAAMDFAALARDAGFVDVEAYGMAPTGDPHVVRGRKPA
jgi:SAM-dependent methyltransferase